MVSAHKKQSRLSQRGGQIYLENMPLFFVNRKNEKYVPYSLVKRYIIPKIREVFTRRLLKLIPIHKVRMTAAESTHFNKNKRRLLRNELFKVGDCMYRLEDTAKLWMFFKTAEDIVRKNQGVNPPFGFVSIGNNLVPFVDCSGTKLVPLFYFNGSNTYLEERTFLVTNPLHLSYLRFCFIAQNIRKEFYRCKSITVVGLEDVKTVFPKEPVDLAVPTEINAELLTNPRLALPHSHSPIHQNPTPTSASTCWEYQTVPIIEVKVIRMDNTDVHSGGNKDEERPSSKDRHENISLPLTMEVISSKQSVLLDTKNESINIDVSHENAQCTEKCGENKSKTCKMVRRSSFDSNMRDIEPRIRKTALRLEDEASFSLNTTQQTDESPNATEQQICSCDSSINTIIVNKTEQFLIDSTASFLNNANIAKQISQKIRFKDGPSADTSKSPLSGKLHDIRSNEQKIVIRGKEVARSSEISTLKEPMYLSKEQNKLLLEEAPSSHNIIALEKFSSKDMSVLQTVNISSNSNQSAIVQRVPDSTIGTNADLCTETVHDEEKHIKSCNSKIRVSTAPPSSKIRDTTSKQQNVYTPLVSEEAPSSRNISTLEEFSSIDMPVPDMVNVSSNSCQSTVVQIVPDNAMKTNADPCMETVHYEERQIKSCHSKIGVSTIPPSSEILDTTCKEQNVYTPLVSEETSSSRNMSTSEDFSSIDIPVPDMVNVSSNSYQSTVVQIVPDNAMKTNADLCMETVHYEEKQIKSSHSKIGVSTIPPSSEILDTTSKEQNTVASKEAPSLHNITTLKEFSSKDVPVPDIVNISSNSYQPTVIQIVPDNAMKTKVDLCMETVHYEEKQIKSCHSKIGVSTIPPSSEILDTTSKEQNTLVAEEVPSSHNITALEEFSSRDMPVPETVNISSNLSQSSVVQIVPHSTIGTNADLCVEIFHDEEKQKKSCNSKIGVSKVPPSSKTRDTTSKHQNVNTILVSEETSSSHNIATLEEFSSKDMLVPEIVNVSSNSNQSTVVQVVPDNAIRMNVNLCVEPFHDQENHIKNQNRNSKIGVTSKEQTTLVVEETTSSPNKIASKGPLLKDISTLEPVNISRNVNKSPVAQIVPDNAINTNADLCVEAFHDQENYIRSWNSKIGVTFKEQKTLVAEETTLSPNKIALKGTSKGLLEPVNISRNIDQSPVVQIVPDNAINTDVDLYVESVYDQNKKVKSYGNFKDGVSTFRFMRKIGDTTSKEQNPLVTDENSSSPNSPTLKESSSKDMPILETINIAREIHKSPVVQRVSKNEIKHDNRKQQVSTYDNCNVAVSSARTPLSNKMCYIRSSNRNINRKMNEAPLSKIPTLNFTPKQIALLPVAGVVPNNATINNTNLTPDAIDNRKQQISTYDCSKTKISATRPLSPKTRGFISDNRRAPLKMKKAPFPLPVAQIAPINIITANTDLRVKTADNRDKDNSKIEEPSSKTPLSCRLRNVNSNNLNEIQTMKKASSTFMITSKKISSKAMSPSVMKTANTEDEIIPLPVANINSDYKNFKITVSATTVQYSYEICGIGSNIWLTVPGSTEEANISELNATKSNVITVSDTHNVRNNSISRVGLTSILSASDIRNRSQLTKNISQRADSVNRIIPSPTSAKVSNNLIPNAKTAYERVTKVPFSTDITASDPNQDGNSSSSGLVSNSLGNTKNAKLLREYYNPTQLSHWTNNGSDQNKRLNSTASSCSTNVVVSCESTSNNLKINQDYRASNNEAAANVKTSTLSKACSTDANNWSNPNLVNKIRVKSLEELCGVPKLPIPPKCDISSNNQGAFVRNRYFSGYLGPDNTNKATAVSLNHGLTQLSAFAGHDNRSTKDGSELILNNLRKNLHKPAIPLGAINYIAPASAPQCNGKSTVNDATKATVQIEKQQYFHNHHAKRNYVATPRPAQTKRSFDTMTNNHHYAYASSVKVPKTDCSYNKNDQHMNRNVHGWYYNQRRYTSNITESPSSQKRPRDDQESRFYEKKPRFSNENGPYGNPCGYTFFPQHPGYIGDHAKTYLNPNNNCNN
ncbi:uncharacterized protein LOC143206638 [Rhynchophorus ferrugineus]|uniref:uncharacterized protein LOC143206638 n=1 Tax=Rhynchophorus ferrugineus TaxID=354439 RepID=UPI003FCC6975